jgi:hypothetical protein
MAECPATQNTSAAGASKLAQPLRAGRGNTNQQILSAVGAAQISIALDKNMPFMCHMQEVAAAQQEAFANHQA